MIKVSFIVNKSTKFFTDYAQSSAYWIPQQSTKKKLSLFSLSQQMQIVM